MTFTLCSMSWHMLLIASLLTIVGYAQEFMRMMKWLPFVENLTYSVASQSIPTCPWDPPPFVVGILAANVESLHLSWFMSFSWGWPSIFVTDAFFEEINDCWVSGALDHDQAQFQHGSKCYATFWPVVCSHHKQGLSATIAAEARYCWKHNSVTSHYHSNGAA